MNPKIKFICPLIVVSDIERSRTFYESVMGQKVIADFGDNIIFRGDFAIHQEAHFRSLIDNREIRRGGNNTELYFEYDDVEQINGMLTNAGVTFVHELREQPWKQRVIRIYDPDSHIIEIAESMEFLTYRMSKEGRSLEEISTITNMPIEFVCDVIKKYSH